MEWAEKVSKGKKVFPVTSRRNRLKIAEESITGGIKTGSETKSVNCPTCETYTQVNIEEREPIK